MRDGTVAHPALPQLQAPRVRGVLPNVPATSGHQRMRYGTFAHAALHLLQAPRLRGVLPNAVRYSAAISACEMGP